MLTELLPALQPKKNVESSKTKRLDVYLPSEAWLGNFDFVKAYSGMVWRRNQGE